MVERKELLQKFRDLGRKTGNFNEGDSFKEYQVEFDNLKKWNDRLVLEIKKIETSIRDRIKAVQDTWNEAKRILAMDVSQGNEEVNQMVQNMFNELSQSILRVNSENLRTDMLAVSLDDKATAILVKIIEKLFQHRQKQQSSYSGQNQFTGSDLHRMVQFSKDQLMMKGRLVSASSNGESLRKVEPSEIEFIKLLK